MSFYLPVVSVVSDSPFWRDTFTFAYTGFILTIIRLINEFL